MCSGPGKLCEALGVTSKHNGLALDRAPFELRARAEKPEVVVGPRIGITKAVELPWRYGLKGSKFLEQAVSLNLASSVPRKRMIQNGRSVAA